MDADPVLSLSEMVRENVPARWPLRRPASREAVIASPHGRVSGGLGHVQLEPAGAARLGYRTGHQEI